MCLTNCMDLFLANAFNASHGCVYMIPQELLLLLITEIFLYEEYGNYVSSLTNKWYNKYV